MAGIINYINWSLIIIAFILNIAIACLLIYIRRNVKKELASAFTYWIIALFTQIFLRIFDLLVELHIIYDTNFMHNFIVIVNLIFIFLAAFKFYKSISMIINKKRSPSRDKKENNTEMPQKTIEKTISKQLLLKKETNKPEQSNEYIDLTKE